MLKGIFYRRVPENNNLPMEVYIRFEINSKESILAKISNLDQEGMQFLLPRSKVILVPDERILLILNSPNHGEFKIQGDVNYFCNISDHSDHQQVCYGVKFFEPSAAIWEVILDFCGNQFPEVTFLSSSAAGVTAAQPIKQPVMPSESAPKATPKIEVPTDPFATFPILPPIIPIEVANIIPGIVAGLHSPGNVEHPLEPPTAMLAASETLLQSKKDSMKNPFLAQSLVELPAQTNLPDDYQTITSPVTAQTNQKKTPSQPELSSSPVAPSVTTPVKETTNVKSESNQTPVLGATVAELHQPTKDNRAGSSGPNSIQALAASLATPPVPHTQSQAQSLSQEMIDRLIEKLQLEEGEAPGEPVSAPVTNPLPDHSQVTASELNQSTLEQNQIDSVGSMGSPVPDIPFTPAPNLTGTFEPKNNLPQPKAEPVEPEQPAGNQPEPFNPYELFNFKSDNAIQPENNLREPVQSKATKPANTDAFENFASFNSQPGTSKSLHDEGKAPLHTDPFANYQKATAPVINHNGISLGDLMSNLDSTINKNVAFANTSMAIAQDQVAAAKTGLKATSNISLEELKKVELPYSDKAKAANIPNTSTKQVSSATGELPAATMTQNSGSIAAAKFAKEKPAASPLKTSSVGPTIIPNTSGVSLDQKAIDKLVDSLIQDMAADEPAPLDPTIPVKPVGPLGSGMGIKNDMESRVNPAISPESILHLSNTNPRLNINGADATKVMDQKSIDKIVKTLTEAEASNNQKSGSEMGPTLTNTIPPKSFTPVETKRTLDQKAIDQVVQALTQNISTKNNLSATNPGMAAVPFNNSKTFSSSVKTTETSGSRYEGVSLATLSAILHLDTGEVLHATVEQIYLGGIMVILEQELPINSSLRLNLSGNGIHITDVQGTCTNCELAPYGKNGFLAEIFFKNLTASHMEQFRTIMAKLDLRH